MPEAYAQLTQHLEVVRQRWRARNVFAGALLASAYVLGALLVLVAADNLLKPGTLGRALMATVFWVVVAAGLIHFVVRRLRENRCDDYFGALAEGKHSTLRNRLVNALQLGRGDHCGSAQIVEAIVDDAAHAAVDVDLTESLDARDLKRSASIAGVCALLVVLYAGLLTPRFANGLSRLLVPTADVPPYTATRIAAGSIQPGDVRVPEGSSVEFAARAAGVIPAQARLMQRKDNEDHWIASPMESGTQDPATFRFALQQATRSFDYYVRAGDARSSPYRVEVVKRPKAENIALTYHPPAYTALPAHDVDESDGEIAGLPGTMVELRLAASKPLREARLAFSGGAAGAIELAKVEDDETAWHGALTLATDAAEVAPEAATATVSAAARYQVKLVDKEGYENVDPVWRSIMLAKDQAPGISIVSPGRDIHADPQDQVDLTVDARDDYGLGEVRLLFRVNDEPTPRELARFPNDGAPETQTRNTFEWDLSEANLNPGDLVQYWAVAADRNDVTGPGIAESRRFTIFIVTPAVTVAKFEIQMNDFVQVLDELVRMQRENRAQTASGIAFETLVTRQTLIRTTTNRLARAMETAPTSLATMVDALDGLYLGLMADAIRLLEGGRDVRDAARAASLRQESLPVQDEIIAQLVELLSRLQRNEQARDRLRKIAKTDEAAHKEITEALARLMQDLDRMVLDADEFAGKYEKLAKRPVDELNEESLERIQALDELTRKWGDWAKGSVDELTKLPAGFVDDFGLRPELERIFEEVEAVAQKPKVEKLHVALEDLGASLATEMLEDLEMWMMDAPDTLQWLMEEPLDSRPMDIPEMPLPDVLQDMVGDLLEEAHEIDQEAEDITAAWGDSLNQAGWAVMDGPISNYSAKGVTGNVLPNDIELSGRAGDGRRGKSSGQMVSETTRNLEGRKTPARVGAERYEPGVVKELASQDPGGATGGGKKAGAGEKGLQGGSPPDFIRDMERLRHLHVGLREHATRVANRLEVAGVNSRRLDSSIQLLQGVENDLRDLRYEDAARRRRVALSELRGVPNELDQSLAVQLSRAHELPEALREELLQAADEGYPEGYESLLKSYYRALSEAEEQ